MSLFQRRRAQNRASQRAFRERKEKHVQELEQQLETLEAKHRALAESHQRLGRTNHDLQQEAQQLRDELKALKASGEERMLDLSLPNDFDRFESDPLYEPSADFSF